MNGEKVITPLLTIDKEILEHNSIVNRIKELMIRRQDKIASQRRQIAASFNQALPEYSTMVNNYKWHITSNASSMKLKSQSKVTRNMSMNQASK